jgi:hypothetical protein
MVTKVHIIAKRMVAWVATCIALMVVTLNHRSKRIYEAKWSMRIRGTRSMVEINAGLHLGSLHTSPRFPQSNPPNKVSENSFASLALLALTRLTIFCLASLPLEDRLEGVAAANASCAG